MSRDDRRRPLRVPTASTYPRIRMLIRTPPRPADDGARPAMRKRLPSPGTSAPVPDCALLPADRTLAPEASRPAVPFATPGLQSTAFFGLSEPSTCRGFSPASLAPAASI